MMNLLPLEKLGARELPDNRVQFGLYVPWVSSLDGNRLWVKIIHEHDQFLQKIQPNCFELSHSTDPTYGDYWSAEIPVDPGARRHPDSAWGNPGRYVYRFMLRNPNISHEIDWIIDPFAREFGVGKLSAFTLGYQPHEWSDHESNWKVPGLSDLVICELMISEFGTDITGAILKLDYLADLGINCLEIMPVSNVSSTIDWGFLPIGYFGVDERFGKRSDMQRFIDEAHKRGIAVILDVVYGHTSSQFPYSYLYNALKYDENPFIGPFAKNDYGDSIDYSRSFSRDFFYTVNYHWLDCYHADGFRYDCVPNYYDGPAGSGYANLVYHTYQLVRTKIKEGGGYWERFQDGSTIRLIQCAEQLEGPVDIVENTYSNCTWQNRTRDAAKRIASGDFSGIADLGFSLGLDGYPGMKLHHSDMLEKSALQYIENHDHSRFICNFGLVKNDNDLLSEGDRANWFKLQPYLIGLFTARGIPMVWQGQELGENYFVPDKGWGRVLLLRPVRWDYFYDPVGQSLIALFRKLITIRRGHDEFRTGEYYFHNQYDPYLSRGVLLFHRRKGSRFSLVALNFSEHDQWIPYSFESSGNYHELLHGDTVAELNIGPVNNGETKWLRVPGHYGRIWQKTS